MLTQQQINQFSAKAKAAGFNDAQIAAEIERKKKETEAAVAPKVTTTPPPSTTQPGTSGMDLSDPGFVGTTPKPIEREKPTGVAGFLDSAVNFLFPRLAKTTRKTAGSVILNKQVETVAKSNKEVQDQAMNLIKRAKEEKDPEKKKRLLDLARDLNNSTSDNIEELLGGFEKMTGVSMEEATKSSGKNVLGVPQEYINEGLGVAGEMGSYLVPAGKLAKGASVAQKVGVGMKTGAKIGAIQGLTDSTTDLEDIGGRVKKGLVDAGFGAIVGGAVTAAYEYPKEAIRNALSKAPETIRGVFKIAPSEMRKFREVNKMDFGEEILARDGKEISGLKYPELVDHMAAKKKAAQKVVADSLKGSKETISTPEIQTKIDEMISTLKPGEGNVNTEGAIATLKGISDTLKKNPKQLTLETANKIKSQLADAGAAAYSPTGNPTPSSEAFADAASIVRKMIEQKAPGVKEANQLIQLYHLANVSIQKQEDAAVNRVASGNLQKFLQTLPAIGGAAAGYGVGGIQGGAAGFAIGEAISGLSGSIRNKFLSPEVQTRIAAAVDAGLKGIENPTVQQVKEVTNRVVQQMAAQLARTATSGVSSEPVQEPQNQYLDGNNGQTQNQQIHDTSIGQMGGDINSTTFPAGKEKKSNTATGYTVEQHLKALAKATAAGDTQAVKAIKAQLTIEEAYQKQTTAAKPSANAQKRLIQLNQAETTYNTVKELALAAPSGMKGVLKAGVGKIPGVEGGAAEDLQRVTDGLAKSIAGALANEVGVATDRDIERWKGLMPKVGDTMAERVRALERLKSALDAERKRLEIPDDSEALGGFSEQ